MFAVRECFVQVHRGDHLIFEHPSNASSWIELCIRKPLAQRSESGQNLFVAWSMSGIFPRGSLGVAWQAMKDAKTGETASKGGIEGRQCWRCCAHFLQRGQDPEQL